MFPDKSIWVITGDSKLIVSPQNKTEWGTQNFTAIALIDHTLNQKDPYALLSKDFDLLKKN
ncbi:hypothetical protein [Pseudanabaena sp. 'Roaring Creek']|uniref:hypothetical protein n=1 Tax=Pseudanabaena sp. 'Roaring Creek' TaxID=1681830 RepID=UPI0006D76D49|nr:hypothetical protein [Pseudanabaena sp. 'Roaring Creek']